MKTNLSIRHVGFLCLLALLFTFSIGSATAQDRPKVGHGVSNEERLDVQLFTVAPPRSEYNAYVSQSTALTLDMDALTSAMKQKPRYIRFEIPQAEGAPVVAVLERSNIFSEDFLVTDAANGQKMSYTPGLYYHGKIAGHKDLSYASVSLFDNMVMGLFSFDGQNLVLGHTGDRGRPGTAYVLYADSDLTSMPPFGCSEVDNEHDASEHIETMSKNSSPTCHTVRFYIEADYQLHQSNGSNYTQTLNYVTGLFSNMNSLYSGISVQAQLAQVAIWWNGSDPYPDGGSSTDAALTAFQNNVAGYANATHNLRCLWSADNWGGGLAAGFDGLCTTVANSCSVSGNLYSTYPAFPTYSWETMVVTHEAGHTLSSRHTHACVWNGNNTTIDGCAGFSEGTCATGPLPASNTGTLMSYCHQSVGINFAYGFGSQPGNKIYNYVNAASCLSCPATAALSCANAIPVSCGGVYTNQNNANYPANVHTYAGTTWNETGPEVVYVLTTTQFNPSITVSLSNMTDDLDIFILNGCNAANAIAYGNNNATITNAAPGTYYIVVDGYFGAVSKYDLSVTCTGYCESTGNTVDEYIQAVTFGGYTNTTGNNNGYANYTGQRIQLRKGANATGTFTPGYTATNYSERWYVYIDYNGDSDFTDAGELAYATSTGVSGATPFSFPVPADLPTVSRRMRIIMTFYSSTTPCGPITYGETEDYTVQFIPYCPSNANTAFEYIDEITVGPRYSQTGNNNGYADYTDLEPVKFAQGGAYNVSLKPGFVSSTYTENWRVWIDFNQNGNFDDAGEQVFEGSGNSIVSGSFTMPIGVSDGVTAMRVSMRFGSYPLGCADNYFSGETEDYRIEIVPNCISQGSTNYEYIESVAMGAYSNVSGNNLGYGDYTGLTPPTFSQGQSIPVSLTAGYPNSTWTETWRIWIDSDNSRTFDPSESIFSGVGAGTVSGGAYIPSTIAPGTYYMRVTMRFGSDPAGCPSGGFSGETEDYLVTIVGGCANPIPTVSVQSSTSALIFWNPVPGATKYNINYRKTGTLIYTSKTVTGTTADLTGLLANSNYEYKIRAFCSGAYVPFSGDYLFSTTLTAACNKPVGLGTMTLTTSSVRMNWSVVSGALGYQVRYKKSTDAAYSANINAPSNTRITAGLSPFTTYQWQVRVRCTSGPITYSAWSSIKTFMTPAGTGLTGGPIEGLVAPDFADTQVPVAAEVTVFPNPTSKTLNVTLNGIQATEARIVSITGSTLKVLTPDALNDGIDVSALPTGLYLLQVSSAEGKLHNVRFMKAE